MPHKKILLLGAILFFFTGCSPLPIPYLQLFSALLSPEPGIIHIERGKKKLHGEFGMSGALGSRGDSTTFRKERSLDSGIYRPDALQPNCMLQFPDWYLNFHGMVLGEKLICGGAELHISRVNGKLLYSGGGGIGVRLYRGPVSGRVIVSLGLSRMHADAEVVTRWGESIERWTDSYVEPKPYLGCSFAVNTRFTDWRVNPALNLNVRYYSLFSYSTLKVRLIALSATGGVYRNIGPVTLFSGMQASNYPGDLSRDIHPRFIGQITILAGKGGD